MVSTRRGVTETKNKGPGFEAAWPRHSSLSLSRPDFLPLRRPGWSLTARAQHLLSAAACSARLFLQRFCDEGLHGRNVFLRGFPQDLIIHPEVLVDEFVPHPGHLFPRNFRVSFSHRWWDFFRRFADNLKRSHHRVDCLLIVRELRPGHACDELYDALRCLLDIRQIVEKLAFARHKPTTSLRIR